MFKRIIGMMISPASVVKNAFLEAEWYFSVIVSAVAFSVFFLQTGLDLYKTGQKGMGFVIGSAFSGAIYGLIAIPIVGVIAWLILKMYKTDKSIKWTISSFCLSYSSALIYGIIGILFSVFLGWKTSVAFGVSGVLWAIGPMIIVIREMTDGKNGISVLIATVSSSIVLLSWALFGNL